MEPETNTPAIAPTSTSGDISAIISDVLKQQASQFENIVSGLQNQITSLKMSSQSSKASKTSKTVKKAKDSQEKPSKKLTELSTPNPRKAPRASAGSSISINSKSPKTPKTPTPTRKRHPLQLLLVDTPKDFQTCKDALFVHIKMMWGLFKPNDVPPAPDPALLQEFYSRFSSSEEVEAVVNDPASTALVGQESILTLRLARMNGGKLGRGLGHIDQVYILYIHGILAKVGIRVWCPDLNDTPDSLYNSACRITALNTFRQLLAGGVYNYMNVNLKYTNTMPLMFSTYNHYVHYLMAAKYKAEIKNAGKVAQQNLKKNVQKHRERLRDSRVEFLFRHRAKFPRRYRDIVDDILAHSDDERIPGKEAYAIKTLVYRSKNANKFFRRLDVEMLKEAQVNGKTSRRRVRKLPKTPIPSEFLKAPKNLPIDFYDPTWYKNLSSAQKRLTANATQVAFLPDANQSLKPDRHPDELLGDSKFSGKYLDAYLEAYDLSEDEAVSDDDDEEDNDDSPDEGGSIVVDDEEEKDDEEEESDFYSEGDCGDLYDMEASESSS